MDSNELLRYNLSLGLIDMYGNYHTLIRNSNNVEHKTLQTIYIKKIVEYYLRIGNVQE